MDVGEPQHVFNGCADLQVTDRTRGLHVVRVPDGYEHAELMSLTIEADRTTQFPVLYPHDVPYAALATPGRR